MTAIGDATDIPKSLLQLTSTDTTEEVSAVSVLSDRLYDLCAVPFLIEILRQRVLGHLPHMSAPTECVIIRLLHLVRTVWVAMSFCRRWMSGKRLTKKEWLQEFHILLFPFFSMLHLFSPMLPLQHCLLLLVPQQTHLHFSKYLLGVRVKLRISKVL